MMTLNKIPFKEVNGAGLFVDTVWLRKIEIHYSSF